jgi:hypothetical protein
MKDTGFGFSFEVKDNNNLEIKNELAKIETIFTPRGSKITL